MKCDFEKLQPIQRSLILVASDEKYTELTNEIDWMKLVWAASSPLGLLTYICSSFSAAESLLAVGVLDKKGLQNLLKKGEIPIPHISPSDAVIRFAFDHGHPQDGTAYIIHAINPSFYLLPSVANERLAQEKVAAFFRLVSSLGGKKMELVSAEILEKGTKAKIEVPLPKAAAQVGIDASFSTKGDVKRSVYSEFAQPQKAPNVPEDLMGWLEVDPMFRSLALTRMNGELVKTKASLTIESCLDFGTSAQAAIKEFKINAGGQYRKVAKSVWSFEIEFWPKR